jgi:ABC-type transport system substrate-binding protein
MAGSVTSLDPSHGYAEEQAEVHPAVFETLTRNEGGARIVPWLAAQYREELGGTRYRFRLRDDVRFHDGRRLTARDVRYSFERLLQNPESESRWLLASIRGGKAIINGETSELEGFRLHSAGEISIELDEPLSFFPSLLAYPALGIVPEGTEDFDGNWQSGCVGTGPFRVAKFERGSLLALERHPGYWRGGYPRSERLVFIFGVSPEETIRGFRSGDFSLASDLFPGDVEALRREGDFAGGYLETPRLSTYLAVFNTRRGPLQDRDFRRRLVRSIDTGALVPSTLGRTAIPARGLIPPGLLGYDPSLAARTIGEEEAAQSVGTGETTVLTAVIRPQFYGKYSPLMRPLESAFERAGVKLRRVDESMDDFIAGAAKGTVDVALGRWAADYPDTDSFVHALHTREGFYGRMCGTPEIDRLEERGRAKSDPAARHGIYRQVEEIVARDALLLPLFHEQVYRFARPEIDGLSVSFWVPVVRYDELSVRG